MKNLNKRTIKFLTLTTLLMLVFSNSSVFAATYTFIQNSWTGGATSNTATHPTNQTGWNQYSSKDSSLAASTTLQLASISASTTQTTDTDFNAGTFSNTITSSTGTAAYVRLSNVSSYQSAVSSTLGLFAYYKLDNNVIDGVNAYNGTNNGVTFDNSVYKYGGYSGYFDGTDYIGLPDNSSFKPSQLSIETWIKTTTTSSQAIAGSFNTNGAANYGWTIWCQPIFYLYTGGGGPAANTGGLSGCDDNNWHHIVGTYDGSVMKFYFDGNLATSTNFTGGVSYYSTNFPVIGARKYNNGAAVDYKFNGNIDEVAFYNTALSSSTIQNHYSVSGYNGSGVFTSSVIDTGQSSNFSTLDYTASIATSTALTIDIRAGNTATPDGTWTSWQTNILNGGSIFALDGKRYVQYRANLSTSDAFTPQLNDITINYSSYPAEQTLISSSYNTNDNMNVLSSIKWTGTAPGSTAIKFQLRTAPDSGGSPGTWTDWLGPSGSSTYYANPAGETLNSSHSDGANDRWVQYKTFLASSDRVNTPVLSSTTITYVVNAPPDFDSGFGTNGVNVLQISTSTDANWGKVAIQYAVKDTDTLSGTATPGYITPSFEYDIGSGWQAIGSQYLAASDLNNKAVSQSSYNTYSATWNAKSQIPGTYYAAARIRVKANDNEAANNTTYATSGNFVLDVKNPVQSLVLNVSAGSINPSFSDDNNIEYRFSNNSNMSADGLNASSGQWQSAGGVSYNTTTTWTFSAATYPVVYFETRDSYGNSASSTAIAPSMPSSFSLTDISNEPINVFREFISWGAYQATTSASFSRYELMRSTDGSNFTILSTTTDANLNYYTDYNLSSSTIYYYKLRTIDSDNDASAFSTIVSDLPNGQGGTDVTAPTISSVTVAETQATWAKITWTTDELSDSNVEYSVSNASTTYSQSASSTAVVTSHIVVLTNLTPNTEYKFRVKSKDILNNEGSSDNGGNGYLFTTISGPIISDVGISKVDDKGATIVWNTNVDSSSYVIYSTNISNLNNNVNVTQVGSAAFVGGSGPLYQHRVSITGLAARTTYYYYVKSIDTGSNTVTDKNGGNYYSFVTTYDTIPPVISGVSTPVISSNSTVVVWSTDELATSRASYGTTSGSYVNTTTESATTSINHVVNLTNLTERTTYYYVVRSVDSAGNASESSEYSFITPAAGIVIVAGGGGGGSVDTIPPQINNISVGDIGAFEATISFDTNKMAVGFVNYGKSSNYTDIAGESEFLTTHKIKLRGLRMGTLYSFNVRAIDKYGNVGISSNQTFTTKYLAESTEELKTIENAAQFQEEVESAIESILPSLIPPFIERPEVVDITENSATVQWRTNIKSYSAVSYATESEYDSSKDNPYVQEVSDTTNKVINHKLELTGLTPNTKYNVMAKSFSLPEVIGKSRNITFLTKAAKISPRAYSVKRDSFRVVWDTDIPASSIVEYKNLKTGVIDRRTEEAKKTGHDVLVDRLESGITFEVKVFGYTEAGNLLESGEILRVTTSRDVTPPVISNFKVESALVPGRTDKLQTIVLWQTDEPANSVIYYSEGVSSVGKELTNKVEEIDSYVQNHALIVTAFKPGTIYQIKIASTDQSGNTEEFGPRTIITPRQAESIFNVIFKNFEDTFKFLRNVGQ